MRTLALMLLAAGPALAEEAPLALTTSAGAQALPPAAEAVPTQAPTPAAMAAPTPAGAPAAVDYDKRGFNYSFSFSRWGLYNAGALAYAPLEVGYAFGNGLRAQTGLDVLYYTGNDVSVTAGTNGPGLQVEEYVYEMVNWRSSLCYRVPMPLRLRPIMGLSLELMRGDRKKSVNNPFSGPVNPNANAPKVEAWSFIGAGGFFGLEAILGPTWSLNFSGRYVLTFNQVPSPIVTQLGFTASF